MVVQLLHQHYHNRKIEINDLKEKAYFNNKGLNILGLKKLELRYGLEFESFKGDFLAFLDSKIQEPIIIIN